MREITVPYVVSFATEGSEADVGIGSHPLASVGSSNCSIIIFVLAGGSRIPFEFSQASCTRSSRHRNQQ